MPANSHRYRQFARQALLQRASAAEALSHSEVVDAFQALRQRLMQTLAAIFGSAAIDALFERSAHLAAIEFAWLADVLPAGSHATVTDVSMIPAPKTADHVVDGFAAALAYDIGLLVALVGEDLILPLVQKAWGPGRPPTASESD
jgi:hypothetical protein